MSDQRFLQEALPAAGKTQRWGVFSVNPLLPPCDQESNLLWLRRELADVRQAIDRLEESINAEFLGDEQQPSAAGV